MHITFKVKGNTRKRKWKHKIMSIFTEVLSVILFSMSFLQEKQNEMPRYFQAANKNLTKFLIGFLYMFPYYFSIVTAQPFLIARKHKENHFLSYTNAKRQRKPIRNETHNNNMFIRCEWISLRLQEQQRNTNTFTSVSGVGK